MRRPTESAWRMNGSRRYLVAIGAGLAGGVVARLVFGVLPEPWGTLSNTSALWGLVPFFVAFGLRARGWRASLVGVLGLAMMVAAWVLLSPAGITGREVAMWAVIAIIAGALCGLAGGAARAALISLILPPSCYYLNAGFGRTL